MFDVINGDKPFPEYSVVLLTKKSSGVYISIQSYSLLSAVCVEKCRMNKPSSNIYFTFFSFYNTNSLTLP